MKKNVFALLLVFFVVSFTLAACSDSDSSGSLEYPGYHDDEIIGDSSGTDSESSGSAVLIDEGRKLIEHVDMEMETSSFDSCMSELTSMVEASDGYIEQSYVSGYEDIGERSAALKLRIPSEACDSFIDGISGLGTVIYKSSEVSDVTMSYTDIQSHLSALRTEQESLLKILETAQSVDEIISLQDRLSNVRYQIESLESQIKVYDNLISYSTVEIKISEVEKETELGDVSVWKQIGNNLSQSFKDLGEIFTAVFIGVASSLPYLLIIGLIIFLVLIFAVIIPKKKKKKIEAASEKKPED